MQTGDRLPELSLRTADGGSVVLPRDLKRTTVIQLLRYYG